MNVRPPDTGSTGTGGVGSGHTGTGGPGTVPPAVPPTPPVGASTPRPGETSNAGTPTVVTPFQSGRLIGGLLLIAVGVVWLLDRLQVVDARWQTVLAGALVAVGVALVALMRDPASHAGLVVSGVLLTAALSAMSLAPTFTDVPVGAGVGDRIAAPTTMQALDEAADLTIGSLQLDLSELVVPAGSGGAVPTAEVATGIGEVSVLLPDDAAVRVHGQAGIGEVRLPGGVERSGFAADATWTSPDWDTASRRLVLEVGVGIGQVEVSR